MKSNAAPALSMALLHEGGFVDHPNDPGGATNKGITIGTLKRLEIDVDGDGDSDLADLKALRDNDAIHVFKTFYWDAVQADLLPSGLDYVVADFSINSGPLQAAKVLQRALGVTADGVVGPKTIAAANAANVLDMINSVSDKRLAFMKRLQGGKLFKVFGKGWTRRVEDVRATAKSWVNEDHVAIMPAEEVPSQGIFAAFIGFILSIFGRK